MSKNMSEDIKAEDMRKLIGDPTFGFLMFFNASFFFFFFPTMPFFSHYQWRQLQHCKKVIVHEILVRDWWFTA